MIPGLRPVDTVMFGFYLVLLALGIVADLRHPTWFVPLGLSVVCAVLWFVARRQLGTAFSVKPQARQLVAAGLYTKLRHPIYVFGTMAFLLVLLALQGWAALAIWAVGTCLGFDAIMKATEPRCYLSGPRSVPR